MSRFIKAETILIDPNERAPRQATVPRGVRRDMCGYGHLMEGAYQRKRDSAWECITCRRWRSRERARRIRGLQPLPAPEPVTAPLGTKLRWEDLDEAPLGATPLEVAHVG